MGYGNYSFEAHQTLTSARAGMQASEIFATSVHPKMNPLGIKSRESRDSKDHPNSLPICFALDISGSMGDIPQILARKELPKFMKQLMDSGVADPQVLFMAFEDARCAAIPLQVGQFESTGELMDKWLVATALNGSGGVSYTGPLQGGESYELALWVAAKHTTTDAWEKRKHKGYLFMTGDETGYPAVPRETVQKVLGYDTERDIPFKEVMAEVNKTWHPFFLIPDQGRASSILQDWQQLFGANVIVMNSSEDTCAVAASLVALGEGIWKGEADVKKHAPQVLGVLDPWLRSR